MTDEERKASFDRLPLLRIKHEVMALLAGRIAEERFTKRSNPGGGNSDLQFAKLLAEHLLERDRSTDRALEKCLEWLRVETEDFIVNKHWSYVETLAWALVRYRTLTRRKIAEVIGAERLRQTTDQFGGDVAKAREYLSIGASVRARRRAMTAEERRAADSWGRQILRRERAATRTGVLK